MEEGKEVNVSVNDFQGHLERVFQRTNLRTTGAPDEAAGPSQQDELPDDFYEFTAEDYFRMKGNRPGEAVLKTRAMREQEERERRARFSSTKIRVQFPDLYVVEASFPSESTIDGLYAFISTIVRPGVATWHLFTVPPKQRLVDRSRTLWEAGLVPLAQVFWAVDDKEAVLPSVPDSESPYLQKWVTDKREEAPQPPGLGKIGEAEREAGRKRAAMQAAGKKQTESEGGARAPKSKPKWLKI
ncbi:tether containing UBX domain for GLUT4 [Klebsormidium nitens]|uniref:Tether containing UBX domain for GLUT4 n=1 Tax=Klebsormidium nitens TaxID=105231 RepID=A0A1Y1I8E4_KLENI|nr:tether containing UBX domain for GLUT4 [Klebsormidium nitens]|eukprot:GAQ86803.1 tether containing UBX domain for GLUT4 [Klebsormidium nitens]